MHHFLLAEFGDRRRREKIFAAQPSLFAGLVLKRQHDRTIQFVEAESQTGIPSADCMAF